MTRRHRRGITVLAESVLAIGIIGVAVLFALVAGNIIGFQTGGFFASSQENIADDISSRIGQMQGLNGTTAVEYRPGIDQYVLTVQEESIISVQLPNRDVRSQRFETVRIENTRIEDANTICIRRTPRTVRLTAGNCSTGTLDDFCTDGNCINGVCQPEYGETCSNAPGDCPCSPSVGEDASDHCQPGYTAAGYIDSPRGGSGDGTVDTVARQCVNQSFVGVQDETDRCNQEFECSGSMTCTPGLGAASGENYCCPSGLTYDPDEDECRFVDRLYLVFVPLQYSDSEDGAFRDWVNNQYLPLWLDDLPVSRSGIRVEILDPAQVDNSQIQSSGSADCPVGDINLAVSEANAHASGNFDHAVGVYKDVTSCGLAYCGSYTSTTFAQGSVNPGPGSLWGPGVAGQEIAHNWGFNHIEPYNCATTCGGTRKYSCSTNSGDYMQNVGTLNDYKPQEEDCIKEVFVHEDWTEIPSFSAADSTCMKHIIP